MKRGVRLLRITFWALLTILLASNSGAPVMAEPTTASSDHSSTQRYRQVNQATLYEMKGKPLTFGSTFEVDLPFDASNEYHQEDTETGLTGDQMDVRHAEMFFQFDKIGKISFGHGDIASNDVSEVDLSGTGAIGYDGPGDLTESIFFYDKDIDSLQGTKDGGEISFLDRPSHKERIRFDTPAFSGIGVSLSTFTDQDADSEVKSAYDAVIRYSGKAGDVSVAAAIGYSTHPSDQIDGKERLVNGSASVAFSGFSFTFAAGNESQDNDPRDAKKYYYGKAGYTMEFWNIGQTALAIDYGQYNEAGDEADGTKTMGFMFVQKLQDLSSEIYAGFRAHDLEHENADYDVVNALSVGTRINF
jgi:hypothetical protein